MIKVRSAFIGCHAPKGAAKPDDNSYWKPDTPLDAAKLDFAKSIGETYLGGIEMAFYSQGFLRTRETVIAMLCDSPISAKELSPYASYSDAEWLAVDPNGDKTADVLMREAPDFCSKVGSIGADFICQTMAIGFSDSRYLFMTHRGVIEPIVAKLLNQWPLLVPVVAFKQGDLIRIDFNDFGFVVGMQYLPAAGAADVIAKRAKKGGGH